MGGANVVHAVCEPCWVGMLMPKPPSRNSNRDREVCCWCGGVTESGIHRRRVPPPSWCGGRRGRHADEDPSDRAPALPRVGS
jgi:hypothetical protein